MDLKDLQKQRLNTIFDIHKSRSWWYEQPREVWLWLKNKGIEPKEILDIGCGDGRWIPALVEVFPQTKYSGLDIIEDHIKECREKWAQFNFTLLNFLHAGYFKNQFDLVLLAGTLNPRMDLRIQTQIFDKIKELEPKYVLVTFDYNSSGYPPWEFMEPDYKELDTHVISEGNKDFRQMVMAHLYGKL